MSLLLLILYPIAIQVERRGFWYFLTPLVVVLLMLDVLVNYTELALLFWDFPRKGEWTFSTRLVRLQHDTGWRGRWARVARDYCNFFDPQHDHVLDDKR